MRVEQFLDRLEGVKRAAPDLWAAICPAHDERVQSLNVREGVDGRILVHCHAGCSAQAIVDSMRLVMADLFIERTAPERREHRAPRPRPEPAPFLLTEDDVRGWSQRLHASRALLERLSVLKGWTTNGLLQLDVGFDGQRLTLPVRDAEGVLRGLVRYAPGGSPKTLAVRGTPRDLWPRPEAFAPGMALLLVEGEPDAIAACSLGVPAVAVPGAATWDDGWPERFAGRRVVVMLDCDTPGRNAAARAVEQLAPVTWVRSVDLGPDRDDGYDLGDLLLAAQRGDYVLRLSDKLRALLSGD